MRQLEPVHFEALRLAMLQVVAAHAKLCAQEIHREQLDDSVMAAMGRVPRHEFVPDELMPFAYEDTPLPIGTPKDHLAAVHGRLDDRSPGDRQKG